MSAAGVPRTPAASAYGRARSPVATAYVVAVLADSIAQLESRELAVA